ncbi:MAG: DUF7405 family protein [Gaiellaceae bacterium]
MRLTRRELLVGGTAAAALGAAGVYELVDQLTEETPPRRFGEGRAPEQHLLDGMRIADDNGVEIVVPTLHHQIVTANVKLRFADLRDEQRRLEEVLHELENNYEGTPAGLAVTVAWGLPYFQRYTAAAAERHLPVDRRASTSRRTQRALLDAIRFPSDPDDTILDDNDVAFLLRSDRFEHIQAGTKAIFEQMDGILETTSIRKGFAGGGFEGGKGLPKAMAQAAGVPGADLIPDGAELFLGFTSTQRHALGPPRIVNFETLGYVDLGPAGYFRGGTHMHLSHVFEDVEAWYLNFDYAERVDTTFRPRLAVEPGTKTVPQPAEEAASTSDVHSDFSRFGAIGHSSSMQSTSRLQADLMGADGTLYRKGTAIPQRADFNTLDNPFFWSSRPERDGMDRGPAAGLHFVVFNPSSDDFHRNRLAMDGVFPDGAPIPLEPRARGQGFNSVLRTTHRQNFLVPPRTRRSFPLVEVAA